MTKEELETHRVNENRLLRERSGEVKSKDPLVSFLYDLLKQYPPGDIESIVLNSTYEEETLFSNGYLANYAKDIAERLRAKS